MTILLTKLIAIQVNETTTQYSKISIFKMLSWQMQLDDSLEHDLDNISNFHDSLRSTLQGFNCQQTKFTFHKNSLGTEDEYFKILK